MVGAVHGCDTSGVAVDENDRAVDGVVCGGGGNDEKDVLALDVTALVGVETALFCEGSVDRMVVFLWWGVAVRCCGDRMMVGFVVAVSWLLLLLL